MDLRPARPDDEAAIAALLGAAFGSAQEVQLVERLRASGEAVAELVAEEGGRIAGQVMLSTMVRPERWLPLAPVAAEPGRQRRGIGSALVQVAVAAARGLATPYPPEITGLLLLGTERPGAGAERVYPAAFAGL